MLQMHTSYVESHIENRGLRHYIQCMMMIKTLYRKLYRHFIGPMRPALASYAV